ncbi:MAG TPA: HD domain-containing protein [Firmicutes bacterium]|nr:HD domain-containing protein [Bacillota bacterium]
MKIKTQLAAGIITIIILSVLVTTYVLVKDTERLLYKEIREKGVLLTGYLQGASITPIIDRDEIILMSYVNKTADTRGIVYLIITDRVNTILAANDMSLIGENIYRIDPIFRNPPAESEITHEGKIYETINFKTRVYVNPKTMRDYIGSIYVGFDKAYIESQMMDIYYKSGIIAVIIIILSVFFILSLTGRIIGPLNRLIEGTEIIAAGDMNHRIRVNVKNEFRVLANSFNAMTEKLEDYYEGILNAFTIAMDTKDKYTPGHSKRAAELGMRLGRYLKLETRKIENIRIAGILKDIGNIGVQGEILRKKDMLTVDDYVAIQKHPELSAKIISNIESLKGITPIILQHHERYDGQGYPGGLKGEEITIEARILAITDAYDAMISPREHRPAMRKEEAIQELRFNKGRQFDPELTEKFIEMLKQNGGKTNGKK